MIRNVLVFIGALLLSAAAVAEGSEISPRGVITVGEAVFYVQHFSPSWQGGGQRQLEPQPGFPVRDGREFRLEGTFPAGGTDIRFELSETVRFLEGDDFSCEFQLRAPRAVATEALFLSVDIPAGDPAVSLSLDREPVILPQEFEHLSLASRRARKVLLGLSGRDIDISGDFAVTVQDNRQFGQDTFSIRLSVPGTPGMVSEWHLAAEVKQGEAQAPAPEMPSPLQVDLNRGFFIGNAVFSWTLFDQNWKTFSRRRDQFTLNAEESSESPGASLAAGVWEAGTPSRQIDFREELLRTGEFSWHYAAALSASEAVTAKCLTFLLNRRAVPGESVRVDGRVLTVPEHYGEMVLFQEARVRSLSFVEAGQTVTVSGDFGLMIQDNRQWSEEIQYRILPEGSSGAVSGVSLELDIAVSFPETRPFDLREAANRGFRDEHAGDGAGGWTDQGPDNDLSMFPAGKLAVDGVIFEIIDPADNGGNACVVLAADRDGVPARAAVTAPDAPGLPYLYLLHASAWTPPKGSVIGEIAVEYPDGAIAVFPVVSGRDCGNWWQPWPLTNGAVVWTGENRESFVGLFLSQFRLAAAPRSVSFTAADPRAVWMIVGAALGDRELDLAKTESPVWRTAGEEWLALDFDPAVLPGSALDFSGRLDKPAGKYGPVIVDADGHFAFRDAPEKRIRFFGPNLVYTANYPSRETADDFVAKAARMGYNTVRFHHFEHDLIDRSIPGWMTFKPESVDRIHYLFAELKKQGFYMTMDLYASREVAGEAIPEMAGLNYSEFELKALAPLSAAAMDNWKEFARRFLTMVNPYTGLTWAEDPALYAVNLINENSLLDLWRQFPALVPLFEARYVEYLQRRGIDTPANRERRDGPFVEFLIELQSRCIDEQVRFLRDELKMTALVTDVNLGMEPALALVRERLDFVDNHQYWDHPGFPVQNWQLPYRYAQRSALQNQAALPRGIMASRIFGKPFTVTEFNYCSPNRNRLEAAGLIGGYAGLQDWDGLYRFAWSHNAAALEAPGAPQGFDIVNDPQAQLAERIIHMLFLRGDAARAEPAFAFRFDPAAIAELTSEPAWSRKVPADFSLLGLYGRIGTVVGQTAPAGVAALDVHRAGWQEQLPFRAFQALESMRGAGRVVSATGQIEVDAPNRMLKVVTPYSEVITLAQGVQYGRVLALAGPDCYQTVALLSLDDRPLAESSDLLLIHLTDLGASRQKFGDRECTLLESFGQLPLLLQRGRVEVALALPEGLKIEALKLDGSPNGEIPGVWRDGVLYFTADNAARPGGVMVYRLTR